MRIRVRVKMNIKTRTRKRTRMIKAVKKGERRPDNPIVSDD